ncbi:arsenite-transporting ATPase protein [Dioscorea alata]|uniref:Arsenite-transporting ATPase protein n=1 Tax=Dioscorea alata TaxID=55571 RepID=A0ACB7W5A8_DIOAL|nr:arsenite-transporting ATPase protein [Dioscorea alata]
MPFASPLLVSVPRSHAPVLNRRCIRAPIMANSSEKSTRLVTFLGKGGSGKTTAAVLAAQHYAKEGLNTCLVVHSQDKTAEELMGCNIGNSPTECKNNLSIVRLETSKMLLEPLERMKKVDARLNLTQGVLDGVVGEELGVLPGMDSIFPALALEKLVHFLPRVNYWLRTNYDIVVYDGISSEETLRLIGATERARWYLKYIRSLAEKTDIGRLTAPSLLKLAYESANLNDGSSDGKTSTEIWNDIEQILERASVSFADSSKFGCYLVMNPSSGASIKSAMRYWGCAIQAGTQISGAFGVASQSSLSIKELSQQFSPLAFACIPYLSTGSSLDWDTIINSLSNDAKHILHSATDDSQPSVRFDTSQKLVTLFMPGFEKAEIKLYQYRGGAELLVEAGDQRRIIRLPHAMQGKVGGAKFINRSLVVTLR